MEEGPGRGGALHYTQVVSEPTVPLRVRVSAIVSLTGAMVFVLALACGAWFYQVRLRAVPPGAAPWRTAEAVLFNFALFSMFALHHSVLARPGGVASRS